MLIKHFEKHWKIHPIRLSFFAGLLFTFSAFIASYILFKNQSHLIGLTTIFFTVVFAMPLFTFLFRKEEALEKNEKSFFKKNHAIIDYHLYFFLGVLVIFSVVSALSPSYVFNLDDFFNVDSSRTLDINLPPPSVSDSVEFIHIIHNNLFVLGLCFALMILFGSGGLFLLVLNASIAGSLLSSFISTSFSEFICNVSIFQIHFIPEIFGFLLAAIAGGIFYVDISKEKWFSKSFYKVAIDAGLLLVLSISSIVIAGLLEVYVVKKLFFSDLCISTPYLPFSIFIILLFALAFLETHRQKHKHN